MKIFKSIIVIIILFGMPLASWYFLKGGLDWRKSKIVELAPKGRFISAFNFENADKNRLFELMTHKTCVVKFKGEMSDLDQSMISQFKNAHTFQYIILSQDSEIPSGWSSKSLERYYRPQNVTPRGGKYPKLDYMIVDTSGFIRQSYVGNSNSTLTALVEDLAVILPRKPEKIIKLKEISDQR